MNERCAGVFSPRNEVRLERELIKVGFKYGVSVIDIPVGQIFISMVSNEGI